MPERKYRISVDPVPEQDRPLGCNALPQQMIQHRWRNGGDAIESAEKPRLKLRDDTANPRSAQDAEFEGRIYLKILDVQYRSCTGKSCAGQRSERREQCGRHRHYKLW